MQEEFNWRDEGISIPIGAHPDYKGDVLMPCPFCSSERKPIHQKQKCFSVNINEGMYYCNHCGTKGRAKRFNEMKDTYHHSRNDAPRRDKPVYQKPTDKGSTLDESIIKYFEKRGISKATLDFARITQGTHDMPQKDGSYKRCTCIHFNYYLNGELVNIKYRDSHKNFMLSKGSERLPYNIDNIKGTEECIWVEGCPDALSFIEAGRTDVVSVPNGAQPNLSYLDYYIEDYFDDKKVIYIAVDNDEPGCRLRDELIHRFGEERCRIVKFGEGCKDANDHLIKYGKGSLLQCLKDANDIPLADVYTVKSFKDKLAEIFVEGRKHGLKLGLPNLDEYITWETKRLLVCTGIPSCLSGDTLITMADESRKPIKDIQVGDKVVCYDGHTRTTSNVSKTFKCWKKDICHITLKNGMHITGSNEHHYYTFEGWKKASELTEDDFIMIDEGAEAHSEPINPDILKLAAMWIADGHKTSHNTCIISCFMPEMKEELQAICDRNNLNLHVCTNKSTSISAKRALIYDKRRYINSMRHYFHRVVGYTYEDADAEAKERYAKKETEGISTFIPMDELKKLGLVGHTTNNVDVPEAIFTQPNDSIALFLNYLFGCDGWVCKDSVGYSSNSIALCLSIQQLLLRFDVNCYVRKKRVLYKGEYRTSWTVDISNPCDIETFLLKIGAFGKDHKYVCDTKKYKSSNRIPRTALNLLEHGNKWFRKYHGVTVIKDKEKPTIGREIVRNCAMIEENEELIQKLSRKWVQVRSIEHEEEVDMYDFTVDLQHNYIANGMVVHNSGKTAFLNFLAVLFNIRHNWRIGFYSPESFPITNHIIDIIELIAGKKYSKQMMNDVERIQLENYIEENFFFTYPEDSSIDNIIAIAGRLVRRYGIRMFVIDPYNNIEYNAHNYPSKTDFVNTLLRKLSDFAKRYDVLVALMAHPTKMAKDKDGNTMIPDLYSISDSANFRNKADYGLVVHRVNEGDKYTIVKVEKVKTKELGSIGDAYFKFNMNNARYIPYTLGTTTQITYDNHSYLDDLKREDTQTYFDEAFFQSITTPTSPREEDIPLPPLPEHPITENDAANISGYMEQVRAYAPQSSSSSSDPYIESSNSPSAQAQEDPFSPLPISDDELPF